MRIKRNYHKNKRDTINSNIPDNKKTDEISIQSIIPKIIKHNYNKILKKANDNLNNRLRNFNFFIKDEITRIFIDVIVAYKNIKKHLRRCKPEKYININKNFDIYKKECGNLLGKLDDKRDKIHFNDLTKLCFEVCDHETTKIKKYKKSCQNLENTRKKIVNRLSASKKDFFIRNIAPKKGLSKKIISNLGTDFCKVNPKTENYDISTTKPNNTTFNYNLEDMLGTENYTDEFINNSNGEKKYSNYNFYMNDLFSSIPFIILFSMAFVFIVVGSLIIYCRRKKPKKKENNDLP